MAPTLIQRTHLRFHPVLRFRTGEEYVSAIPVTPGLTPPRAEHVTYPLLGDVQHLPRPAAQRAGGGFVVGA